MIKNISFILIALCCFTLSTQAQELHSNNNDLIPLKASEVFIEDQDIITSYPDLRLTPDKPEVLTLDTDGFNVIVGNTDHLAVVPETPRRFVLIPRAIGSTYLRILDDAGSTIMERHIIIGAPKPKENYVRIRRACNSGDDCEAVSLYYCPGSCHEIGIPKDGNAVTQPELIKENNASQNSTLDNAQDNDNGDSVANDAL